MKQQNELQAGLFILLALALLGASIWIMGQERQIFAKQQEFHAVFHDIQGLSQGAGVRLGGISIGRVASFAFAPDKDQQKINVTLLVNDSYVDRLREDSVATLQTQGLLGDKFINILPGTMEARVPPGGSIKTHEAGDLTQMFAKAGNVVDNAAEITSTLKDFLKNFDKETLNSISAGFKSVGQLSDQVQKGDGLLHRLIYSKKDADSIMSNINAASDAVKEVLDAVKSGDGLLHALVYEKDGQGTVATLGKAAGALGEAATSLSGLVTDIKSGNGVVHDLIYTDSPQGLGDVVAKLNDTISNLKSASEALARGSGTIGALLVDSQLYDNLVEVTDGAKRSFILRHAIRSALEAKDDNANQKKDKAG